MPIRIPLLYLITKQLQWEQQAEAYRQEGILEKKEIEKLTMSGYQSDLADNLRGLSVEAVYLSRETSIKVITMNSNASLTEIKFKARVLYYSTGEIADIELRLPITTSDRSQETNTITSLRNAYLISCQVDPSQVTRYGQCLCQVVLNNVKTGYDVCMLLFGYLEGVRSLAMGIKSTTAEKSVNIEDGYLRVVTGTDPAAGVEISETVPTNARWELMAVRIGLTTSATVANRGVQLIIDGGSTATQYYVSPSPVAQVASLTYEYSYATRGETRQGAVNNAQLAVELPVIPMLQGHRIRTVTTNIDGSDDFAAPILLVKEKIEE